MALHQQAHASEQGTRTIAIGHMTAGAHQELALDEVLNALLDLLDVWLEHALQLLHHLEHQLRQQAGRC